MKTHSRFPSSRASALVSSIIFVAVVAAVAGSMLTYTLFELRLAKIGLSELLARNAAESSQEYVLAQMKSKLKMRNDFSETNFATGTDRVTAPPDSYFSGSGVETGSVEVLAGLAYDPTRSNSLVYLDPQDVAFQGSDFAGLSAFIREVPVVSKCTVVQGGMSVSCYLGQTVRAYILPLFSFAVFYNSDMEFFPGPDMTINGPVHANGHLYFRKQSSAGRNLDFLSRVSGVGGLFCTKGNKYHLRSGSIDNTNYTDNVRFSHSGTGVKTGVKNSSSVWRDHLYGAAAVSPATLSNFAGFVSSSYNTNLRTSVHAVAPLIPPGFGDNPDTPAVDPVPARTLIEEPKAEDDANPTVKAQKLSRLAGLFIVVNPDPNTYADTTYATIGGPVDYRTAMLPNGSTVKVAAGRYRVFTKSGTEVLLPGQRWYGYPAVDLNSNYAAFGMPAPAAGDPVPDNPADADTAYFSLGTAWTSYGNAVVRMYCDAPTAPAASANNTFYDLRRVKNAFSLTRSSGAPHTPRPVVKVDIDMQNLKKTVAYSVNGGASVPIYSTKTLTAATAGANWNSSVYNPNAGTVLKTLNNNNAIYDVATQSPLASASFWNGTVYILSLGAESGAAQKGSSLSADPRRPDSGIRLVHGRGYLANGSGAIQGLTVATNDALYIVGHYNANGAITTGTADTSSRYPDGAEKPAAVMADAIAILSHPTFTYNSGTPKQTAGWNDAFSRHRIDGYSAYSASWATSTPSTSNTVDGISTTVFPFAGPLDPNSGNAPAYTAGLSYKFKGAGTEISTAFLTGLVPSSPALDPTTANGYAGNATPTAYSGGVHNFPRFLEDWYGNAGSPATCAIRGSMVNMFNSLVANEPWTLRVYQAPTRLWGLHQLFINGTLPPFTPNVVDFEQLNCRNLTAGGYEAEKARILSLGN